MLIDIRQIRNGLTMYQDVETLKASYDAAKVYTDIAGGTFDHDGNPVTDEVYEVNELLALLKTSIDTLEGTGEGSIGGLQDSIDAINEKAIKDIVKLTAELTVDDNVLKTYTLDFTNLGEEATLPDKLLAKVPGYLTDNPAPIKVYFADNQPVFDASGVQVTYDLSNNTFSDIPHTRVVTSTADPETGELTTEITYEPVENSSVSSIKMFPIGSFSFEDLPEDYLLDNSEMNAISYNEIMDGLRTELVENDALIDHIISLLGSEDVQTQITTITDALDARLTTLESTVVTNNIASLDADRDLQYAINIINSVSEVVDDLEVSADDQTEFTLTKIPTDDPVEMYVNGIRYHETDHFTVVRATKTVTWTYTEANGGFDMEYFEAETEGFDITFKYYTEDTVTVPDPVVAAGQPTNVSAVQDSTNIVVTWTDGTIGVPEETYTVKLVSNDGISASTALVQNVDVARGVGESSLDISSLGLAAGDYKVFVLAVNDVTSVASEGFTVDVYQVPDVSAFTYVDSGDGGVIITAYDANIGGTGILIPDELGGKPVKEIGQMAFSQKGLTHIKIPNTVWKIAAGGFYGNWQMKLLNIPSNVTQIGGFAFEYCTGIEEINIEGGSAENPLWIDSKADSGQILRVFGSIENLTSVTFGNDNVDLNLTDNVDHFGIGRDPTSEPPENLTIYGPSGGAVEAYATQFGIPFTSL